MKKDYLISDTHFGHTKMIEYCGRPEGFEEILLKEIAKLDPTDTLIHLGDVCIGNDEEWHARLEECECCKILVRGNHDKKSNKWYYEHGWTFVCRQFKDKFFGKNILFSHAPKAIDSECDMNIHGHFHNALPRLLKGEWKVDGEKERNEQDLLNIMSGKHKLIACEYTNYKPVLLKHIIN